MPLTLEERERIAYIEGRTEEAALLQQAIDAENEALDFARQNDQLKEDLEAAEEKVLTLTTDLENTQDEVRELQARIHKAGVDLVA